MLTLHPSRFSVLGSCSRSRFGSKFGFGFVFAFGHAVPTTTSNVENELEPGSENREARTTRL